jgi:2-polyprenyl-3-methyl-5-hydroxy-6-metoxy-1,4-benzoquinol methylase
MVDTEFRSDAPEIMDDFSMEGEILRDALDKIARINTLLGGNRVTLDGVRALIRGLPADRVITILDVGCGNGDMLRTLAEYGHEKGLQFDLYGIDANAFTIGHARNLSKEYPNISYSCQDIFIHDLEKETYDIILCTLTLHHFKDPELLTLLHYFKEKSAFGIVINDLHRSALAYYLFKALCFIFGLNDMSREDGLVSILRGFKKKDLIAYSKKLKFSHYSVRWRWAFRYQWVIRSI